MKRDVLDYEKRVRDMHAAHIRLQAVQKWAGTPDIIRLIDAFGDFLQDHVVWIPDVTQILSLIHM